MTRKRRSKCLFHLKHKALDCVRSTVDNWIVSALLVRADNVNAATTWLMDLICISVALAWTTLVVAR